MNEFKILEWIRNRAQEAGPVAIGPGDDCAEIRMTGSDLTVSIDAVSEGIHFKKGEAPYRIGWKGAGASLSDIAAAGCNPLCIIAALQIERGRGAEYIQEIFNGLSDVCALFDIAVAGGDLSEAVSEDCSDKKESLIHALTDGEDFELLFTVEKDDLEKLEKSWSMETRITCIGHCTEQGHNIEFKHDEFNIGTDTLQGYEHDF